MRSTGSTHPIIFLQSNGTFNSVIDSSGLATLVSKTAIQSDGKIIGIGSVFFHNGVVHRLISRYGSAGLIDETFARVTDTGTGNDVSLDSNGDIYLIGSFSTYGGISRNKIAKLYGSTQSDVISPTITNVSSSNSNGSVALNGTVAIQVTFSEAVAVSGTPMLTLETGTIDRKAVYTSGAGTSVLTFTYTVQSQDRSSDLEYTNTNALLLESGTIKDTAGNDAVLYLPEPQTTGSLSINKNIRVEGSIPNLFAVSVDGTTMTLLYDQELDSESVPSASDFIFKKNGVAQTGIIQSVSISGTTVTVLLSQTIKLTDQVTLSYTPGSPVLRDSAGNVVASFSDVTTSNGSLTEVVTPSSGGASGGSGGGSSSLVASSGVGVAVYVPMLPQNTNAGTSNTEHMYQVLTAKQVQQYLNRHGFPIAVTGPGSYGKETNTIGPRTKTALLKFQKASSLPVTGTLNPQTLAYIAQIHTGTTTVGTTRPLLCTLPLYLTKPIQYGAKNNPKDVKLLETFLNEFAGFNLSVDGIYGAKDRQAVIAWQEQNKDAVLTPWRLSRGTGYVFTTSLEKIKQVVEAGCAIKK